MVGVAQLAEHLNVAQEVAGSNPVTHPSLFNSGITIEIQKAMIAKRSRGFLYQCSCQKVRRLLSFDFEQFVPTIQ